MRGGSTLDVAGELGLDEEYFPWLASLETADTEESGLGPLGAEECARNLARLGCSEEDVADVLATMPSPSETPARWWLLERCYNQAVAGMGDPDAPRPSWPELPGGLGTAGRCFYLHLYCALVPKTLAWHRRRGIPEEISWATLADLGRHVAIHRRVKGTTGIDVPGWMTLHPRALIYEIGRLQYNLGRIGVGYEAPLWLDEPAAKAMGAGFRRGDPTLGLHIPEGSPLELGACKESLSRAASFFDSYFPVPKRRVVTCTSWLLDDQLTEYLSPESNIVRFQSLFSLAPGWIERDQDIFTFVFRDTHPDLEHLPQRTTLERAAVGHVRAGRHWRVRTGWIDLDALPRR